MPSLLSSAMESFKFKHHAFPLLIATTIAINGNYPLMWGHENALRTFGFPDKIARAREAWPVITVGSARVSSIGLALWGMFLTKNYQAMDILLASLAYMGLIDCWVMWKEGRQGTVAFRGISTALVAAWGVFGMTSARWPLAMG